MINISTKVDVRGIIKQLADVKDSQLPFATSLAINRTAQKVRDKEQHEIRDIFDRPTPFIQNSVFIKPSNKQNLIAVVGLKDQGKPAATKILQAEIVGGSRRLKRNEIALRSVGALPEGYYTVPGEAAKLDQYGNISNGQLKQILSYFRSNREAGFTSNSTKDTRAKLRRGSKKKYGISYFAGSPGDGKSPLGIWMRIHSSFGTAPRPILIFVRHAQYEPIYDFEYVAKTTIDKEFDNEFIKAWNQAQSTAINRGQDITAFAMDRITKKL